MARISYLFVVAFSVCMCVSGRVVAVEWFDSLFGNDSSISDPVGQYDELDSVSFPVAEQNFSDAELYS